MCFSFAKCCTVSVFQQLSPKGLYLACPHDIWIVMYYPFVISWLCVYEWQSLYLLAKVQLSSRNERERITGEVLSHTSIMFQRLKVPLGFARYVSMTSFFRFGGGSLHGSGECSWIWAGLLMTEQWPWNAWIKHRFASDDTRDLLLKIQVQMFTTSNIADLRSL